MLIAKPCEHRERSLAGIAPQSQQQRQHQGGQHAQCAWIEPRERDHRERQCDQADRAQAAMGAHKTSGAGGTSATRVRTLEHDPPEPYSALRADALLQVPTAESSHSPKLVNATITVSIQYWERTASCALR